MQSVHIIGIEALDIDTLFNILMNDNFVASKQTSLTFKHFQSITPTPVCTRDERTF